MTSARHPLHFRYTEEEASAIFATLPAATLNQEEIVPALEQIAKLYRLFSMGKTSVGRKASRDAAQFLRLVGPLCGSIGGIKMSYGLQSLGVTDFEVATLAQTLNKIIGHARMMVATKIPALRPYRRTEKIERRMMIENAALIWWVNRAGPFEQVTSQMLDFLQAVLGPVLVMGDRFNSDQFAARDALAKVLDVVLEEGLIVPMPLFASGRGN